MASKKDIMKKKSKGKDISSKDQAKISAPRNPIVMAAANGQIARSGAHADKLRDSKNGKLKHKQKNFGY